MKNNFSAQLNGIRLLIVILVSTLAMPLAAQNDNPASNGAITIESNPSGALVYLKGEYQFMGRTPFLLPYPLFGKYKIQANRRGYYSVNSEHTFSGESGNIMLLKLSPRTPSKALARSLVFPGWGQYYSGRRMVGTFFMGATAAAFVTLTIKQNQYADAQDDYKTARASFNRGGSFAEEQAAYTRLQVALDKLESTENARNTSRYIAAGVWILNAVESVLFFPRDHQEIEFFQKLAPRFSQVGNNGMMLTMQFPF